MNIRTLNEARSAARDSLNDASDVSPHPRPLSKPERCNGRTGPQHYRSRTPIEARRSRRFSDIDVRDFGTCCGWGQQPSDCRTEAAFTLVEIMIAMSIALMIMAAVMIFLQFGGTYLSGITAQSAINQQAGNAIEFIQMRVRLATSVSNSPSGNSLTLSFDDNPAADSDADGTTYNDRDHWERFAFVGVNGSTNNASTNQLVYIPNLADPLNKQVLIPAGIRNLPGSSIFAVTNQSTVVIRFSVGDGYVRGHYQGVEIQSTAVPLNRPVATNFVGIIP